MSQKICTVCKDIELTDGEISKYGDRCHYCMTKIAKQTAKALGMEFDMPDPTEVGRPRDFMDQPKPSLLVDEEERKNKLVPRPDARAGFINNPNLPDFTTEAKNLLKKEFAFDVDNPPPFTVVEARGQEGTVLRLEITANVPTEWLPSLQEILNRDLAQIVRALSFGTKHHTVLEDLTKYLNSQDNGPFPNFFGGGE